MTHARSCVALSAVLLLLLASAGAARAAAKRVGVPKFDGAQEALVRKQVMQVLKARGYELVKSREMEAAVSSTGALLESDDGFQKVAKELSLMAIVTGEVGKKRAKVIVHDGREGSVLGEASFPGANPKKIAAEVGKSFWKQLGADVERGHVPSGSKKPKAPVADAPEDDENAPGAGGESAPPEPETPKSKKGKSADIVADGPSESEPEPEAAPKKKKKKKKRSDEDTGEDDEGAAGSGLPPIDVAVGMGGVNRGYAYNQDVTGMRPYNLPLGAAAVLRAVIYPIGMVMEGSPLQNLGLELNVEQAFGIASNIGAGGTDPLAGASFGTSVHEYGGGARYRIPFGAAHQLWFSATGGEHAFVFTSSAGCDMATNCRNRLDIPDTIYRFVQPGVGARFEFGNIAVAASAGYRLIFNGAGNHFQTFFPHRTVGGLTADAYVGYRFMNNLEARGSVSLRRYFFDMHSVATDTWRAGGAIDQYISFGVGVAFLFGGSDRPEAAEAEEEAPPKKKKKKKVVEEEEASEE
jgi:hypothetical protein